jgi:outer membrane protein assembly factor BamA
VNLRFVILALVEVFALDGVVHAQLPPRLEHCLPYPTLAQEISAMQEETRAEESQSMPAPRVIIASILFAPATRISEFTRSRIISSIKSPEFYDDPNMTWLEEMQNVGIRWTLQDSGYMNAKVKVDARLLDGSNRRNRYMLTLHIEEGRQYRLWNVRFKPADPGKVSLAFSASELRQYVHMRRGDLFSATKVRSLIQEIRVLYAAKGYIDMVAEPVIQNDDAREATNLTMEIDEGPQYRIGQVDFLGLDENSQSELKPQLRAGEPFNESLVDELLKRNKSLLPADASWQDVRVKRNTKEGVVDVQFYFFSCPDWNTASASSR